MDSFLFSKILLGSGSSVPGRLSRGFVAFLIALGISFLSCPAQAAERVVLKYGILQAPVSVAELANLAETGEVSLTLAAYLRLAQRNPEELRQVLNQEVRVQGTLLDRLLNSGAGEFLLDQAGEIIQTPSDRANRQALRSALVSSALPDDRVTLLEILQNYPTQDLQVNGDRLVEIAQSFRSVIEQFPRFPLPFSRGLAPGFPTQA